MLSGISLFFAGKPVNTERDSGGIIFPLNVMALTQIAGKGINVTGIVVGTNSKRNIL